MNNILCMVFWRQFESFRSGGENCKFRLRKNLKRGERTNLVIPIAKHFLSFLQTGLSGTTALSALIPVRQSAATRTGENKHPLAQRNTFSWGDSEPPEPHAAQRQSDTSSQPSLLLGQRVVGKTQEPCLPFSFSSKYLALLSLHPCLKSLRSYLLFQRLPKFFWRMQGVGGGGGDF